MSQQIKELFSNIAPTYDLLNHLLSLNLDKKWRKKTIYSIPFDPDEPICGLDLCAGTLDLSIQFLNRFRKGSCHAVDFSQPMLDIGISKIPDNQRDRLNVTCADALNLPFPDNTFNVAFCGYGFRNLDDPEAGIKEIYRVLKPNGSLLLLEFFRPEKWMTKLFHKTYGNLILPSIGRLISGKNGAYRYLKDSIADFYSLGECVNMLEKQRFNSIKCKNFFMNVSSLVIAFKST